MSNQDVYPFQAFMAAIPHDQIDYVHDTLLEYTSVTQYLIACETTLESHIETNGEHMHFLVRMSNQHYKNFADRVFKKKYALRGRAAPNKPRQYGKLKEIIDLERMGTYTCKENNLRTNLDDKTLKRWIEGSFKQKESDTWREKVFEALDEYSKNEIYDSIDTVLHPYKPCVNILKIQILQFYKDNEAYKINRNTITHLALGYCMSRNYPNNYILDYFL